MGMKEIWDGKDLPPIGSAVLAQLGSLSKNKDGGWVRHLVAGYNINPASGDLSDVDQHYHRRVEIQLKADPTEPNSSKNCRNLGDIRPVDWRPGD